MELAAHDAEVERRISGYFKTMEAKLAAALLRAKAAGELAEGVEPATAARLLASVAAGLRVMGKTVPDRATTQATVDALLDQFTK
jgi:TetR/AcrR family transcriptional repressor of nem operon